MQRQQSCRSRGTYVDSAASAVSGDLLEEIKRPEFRSLEILLEDRNEILWRQVHPNNVSEGVVNNVAFDEVISPEALVGTPKARYEVSASMASAVSAQDAYEHFTKNHLSAGSYAVSVGDVQTSLARAIDDSATYTAQGDVVGHAIIDLRGMPRVLQKRARSILALAATRNRRKFPLENQ